MAHIPLIHGSDGAKLSKRHGALGVDAYRALGYLPAALRNYLVRLGWSAGDREIFTTQEMIDAFDLPQIGRSPARFDFAKLENINGLYMRAMPDDDLLKALIDTLPHLEHGAEHHDAARRRSVEPRGGQDPECDGDRHRPVGLPVASQRQRHRGRDRLGVHAVECVGDKRGQLRRGGDQRG